MDLMFVKILQGLICGPKVVKILQDLLARSTNLCPHGQAWFRCHPGD